MDNYDARTEDDPSHVCKHCDIVGDDCEACYGEGGRTSEDGHPLALCPACKGYGVLAYPRGKARCACPRDDARDCIRWRMKDDMREHLGAPTLCDEDEECECSCHGQDEDEFEAY